MTPEQEYELQLLEERADKLFARLPAIHKAKALKEFHSVMQDSRNILGANLTKPLELWLRELFRRGFIEGVLAEMERNDQNPRN